MDRQHTPTLWVLSELYRPEQTSTGYVMTAIAESLTESFDVRVICAQPNYSAAGVVAPREETLAGVRVRRVGSTRFQRHRVSGRLVNAISTSLSLGAAAFRAVRQGDRMLVVTNPPLLPFVSLAVARLRGARCTLLVHDVHPEQMVAVGMLREGSMLVRVAGGILNLLYRRFDRIIVIGRDMEELFHRRLSRGAPPIHVITNWADPEVASVPAAANNALRSRLGWEGKFIVQYAGNFGLPNNVECLVDAAESLAQDDRFRFLLVGAGAKLGAVRASIARRNLTNIVSLDAVTRTEQSDLLAAGSINVVPLVSGMLGLGVPSRAYNAMAAGRPILVVGHPESELARLVADYGVGWLLPDTESIRLPELLREIIAAGDWEQRGGAARSLASGPLARTAILAKFQHVLLADD